MNKQSLSGIFIVAVVALGLWLVWPAHQPMPPVTFNLLDGRKLTTDELRGRPLLINFWSVSCPICLHDMPALTRLQNTMQDDDLMVIGVAMPYDPPPAVIDLVNKLAPGYPIALDVHGEISQAFGDIQATPTNFLIAPDGSIRLFDRGPIDEVRIRATVLTF